MGYPAQTDKEKKISVGADAIAALRKHVGPIPDIEAEGKDGLSLEEARERIEEGADPVLEARVIYAAAQQEMSHFLAPLQGAERVYPSIKIHAQASGRWSITDPPLQQFPEYLQDLLIPDPGDAWVGWDWDQIELRVLAALAGDEPYLQAFERGDDVHTNNAIAIFGPPSGNKATDELRRSFAKRFVYRLNYGGDPRTAGDIPGAQQLGLTSAGLVAASQRYLAVHPAMAAWRVRVAAEAKTQRVSRTFMGRRRRLLGEGQGVIREAYNHPMQGAVADILNVVTIQINRAFPAATLVYTVHDAAWWAVDAEQVDTFKRVIGPILTQPWSIGARGISIPVKWKPVRYGRMQDGSDVSELRGTLLEAR
jgi:DNA polymerase-1